MNFDNQIQNIQKYGYRRMTKALKELGFTVNHKKVLRIMTEHAWFCQAFNRQKRKYNSYKEIAGRIAKNHLKRRFNADRSYQNWWLILVNLDMEIWTKMTVFI